MPFSIAVNDFDAKKSAQSCVRCNRALCKRDPLHFIPFSQVPSEKLRWAVGAILAEGDQQPDEELVRSMCGKGFKTFDFPLVSNAVKCVFPFRSYLSVIIAIFRVYPLMGEFVKVRAPTHGRICQGKGSTHSSGNSSR